MSHSKHVVKARADEMINPTVQRNTASETRRVVRAIRMIPPTLVTGEQAWRSPSSDI
jgi:hypothetical protein